MPLKGAVAVAYSNLMQREVHNKYKVLLGDVDFFYPSEEEESADDKISGNTVTVGKTGERDENSVINPRPDYSTDA